MVGADETPPRTPRAGKDAVSNNGNSSLRTMGGYRVRTQCEIISAALILSLA